VEQTAEYPGLLIGKTPNSSGTIFTAKLAYIELLNLGKEPM
jgi:hypothetical protein